MNFSKQSDGGSTLTHSQIMPFDSESQSGMGSFQTLHTLSKALFENCAKVQTLMDKNRQSRLLTQQQLTNNCRLFMQTATCEQQRSMQTSTLQSLRQQISDLEAEHVLLHKQFISLQAQFRQVVEEQRRNLVGTINRTRARTAPARAKVPISASMPANRSCNDETIWWQSNDRVAVKKSA